MDETSGVREALAFDSCQDLRKVPSMVHRRIFRIFFQPVCIWERGKMFFFPIFFWLFLNDCNLSMRAKEMNGGGFEKYTSEGSLDGFIRFIMGLHHRFFHICHADTNPALRIFSPWVELSWLSSVKVKNSLAWTVSTAAQTDCSPGQMSRLEVEAPSEITRWRCWNCFTGWWFGTWMDYFPFHIWDVIPTPLTNSLHHFSEGLGLNQKNQP